MIIDFYVRHAEKLYPKRWLFLTTSLVAFFLVFSIGFLAPAYILFAAPFLGPFIVVPWGLLCMCTWFHPAKGNMQATSKLFGKFPPSFQWFFRWYSAIFLTLFFIFGLTAFTIFVMLAGVH